MNRQEYNDTHSDISIFIGLEIHVQLNSTEKLFCVCSTAFGDAPNSNVCPICLGYPGVLPVLNEGAITKAYTVARALNCTLATETAFARKNYFYPDLPKNYQISQFAAPLGRNGTAELGIGDEWRTIGIHEVHLEEDAGKMIHSGDISLVDFNRTGTPLLEIVTEPDLRSAHEAELLLQQIQQIVRYLDVSDGNMDEGSLRCDANVSIAPVPPADASLPDYKVEIKNMNSSRFVRLALAYEIQRQRELWASGQMPAQETRLWNENRDCTVSMRSKEESMDYRYFPEPDLPCFAASTTFLEHIDCQLVELPHQRIRRIITAHELAPEQAHALCADKATADYFEDCVALGASPQTAYHWIVGEVRKQLNRRDLRIETSPITAQRLSDLLALLATGEIHGKIAKQVLQLIVNEDQEPRSIIDEHGWRVLRGAALQQLVQQVFAAHPQAVASIKAGEQKPIGFLIGKVMQESDGQADPQETGTLVRSMVQS